MKTTSSPRKSTLPPQLALGLQSCPTDRSSLEVRRPGLRGRFLGTAITGAFAFFILNATNAKAEEEHFFFSFQDTPAGTSGTVNFNVTAETFLGTPTFTKGGNAGGSSTSTTGGEASFTAFDGITYLGSGSNASGGFSATWNGGYQGAYFDLNFNATDLEDFQLRLAVRSAGTGALSLFSDILYSTTGPSGTFTSAGFTEPQRSFATGSFQVYTLDLSGLAAIENQSDVSLRFTFGNVPSGTSFRIDNIQVSATVIPEPSSTALLIAIGLGALVFFRRWSRPSARVKSARAR